jgi:AbrB family looped-hinge helix DNA binding protein
MRANLTTLTDRGQISVPASLRKQLHLKPGQELVWEKISDDECRVRIVRQHENNSLPPMRGFMRRFHQGSALPATTTAWMKWLLEGERH